MIGTGKEDWRKGALKKEIYNEIWFCPLALFELRCV